jgi:hypothetical protein
MRISRCMFMVFMAAAGLAAQDSAKAPDKTSAQTAAKETQKAAQAPTGLPKDAVEVAPGFYNWTDKDGKVWTYRPTPFGVRRWPTDSMYTKDAPGEHTTAVEEGDSIRFELSTPFGKRAWVRKKTELNDTEKAIWASQQNHSAAAHTAEKE